MMYLLSLIPSKQRFFVLSIGNQFLELTNNKSVEIIDAVALN